MSPLESSFRVHFDSRGCGKACNGSDPHPRVIEYDYKVLRGEIL